MQPRFSRARADLHDARDRPVPVEHRAVAVGDVHALDDLRQNQGRIERVVLARVERNAVDQGEDLSRAEIADVDARRAFAARANDQRRLVDERLVERARALLRDVFA